MNWVSKEWAKRAALPSHVVTMLDNFPTNLHPMSQFSAAITALNSESSFARAYSEGVNKTKYWEVSSHAGTSPATTRGTSRGRAVGLITTYRLCVIAFIFTW